MTALPPAEAALSQNPDGDKRIDNPKPAATRADNDGLKEVARAWPQLAEVLLAQGQGV
jgi:hypothetical protein